MYAKNTALLSTLTTLCLAGMGPVAEAGGCGGGRIVIKPPVICPPPVVRPICPPIIRPICPPPVIRPICPPPIIRPICPPPIVCPPVCPPAPVPTPIPTQPAPTATLPPVSIPTQLVSFRPAVPQSSYYFGLSIQLTPTQYGNGAMVHTVAPAGPASRAGLEPGDVILSANGLSFRDVHSIDGGVARLQQAVAASGVANLQVLDIRTNQVRVLQLYPDGGPAAAPAAPAAVSAAF